MRNRISGSSPGKTFKPRKTKLLIVTPPAALKLRGALSMSRRRGRSYPKPEPRVRAVLSARLQMDSRFKF